MPRSSDRDRPTENEMAYVYDDGHIDDEELWDDILGEDLVDPEDDPLRDLRHLPDVGRFGEEAEDREEGEEQ